jgi:hypothetical protein
METSHPPSAPSAADVEKALAGIDYPKSKQDLMQYISQKSSTIGSDLAQLIQTLPERNYICADIYSSRSAGLVSLLSSIG